jgi:glycosyltransferase involved in cell wall biosynthesis
MNILILFKGSYPHGLAMTNRLKLYARGLKELGNSVKIVIPHASDKYGVVRNVIKSGSYEGVPFRYLSPTTVRSRYFFARRFADIFGYLRTLLYLMNYKNKFDIVFLIDIRNYWRLPIYFLSKIRGAKVIYELNEHPLVFSGKSKYRFEKNLIFRLYDGYVVISENLQKLVLTFKKTEAKIVVIPILTSQSVDEVPKNHVDFRYIFHSGSLSDQKEGVLGIIKAFSCLVNDYKHEIYLLFTGSLDASPDKNDIVDLMLKLKINSLVKFMGYLSQKELQSFQANSELFFLNKPDTLQNRFCFPTKLGEYMSLGKPIIATNIGEYSKYLIDGVNAVIIEQGDTKGMANAAHLILSDQNYSKKIGMSAKDTAHKNFNYSTQAARLNNFLLSL